MSNKQQQQQQQTFRAQLLSLAAKLDENKLLAPLSEHWKHTLEELFSVIEDEGKKILEPVNFSSCSSSSSSDEEEKGNNDENSKNNNHNNESSAPSRSSFSNAFNGTDIVTSTFCQNLAAITSFIVETHISQVTGTCANQTTSVAVADDKNQNQNENQTQQKELTIETFQLTQKLLKIIRTITECFFLDQNCKQDAKNCLAVAEHLEPVLSYLLLSCSAIIFSPQYQQQHHLQQQQQHQKQNQTTTPQSAVLPPLAPSAATSSSSIFEILGLSDDTNNNNCAQIEPFILETISMTFEALTTLSVTAPTYFAHRLTRWYDTTSTDQSSSPSSSTSGNKYHSSNQHVVAAMSSTTIPSLFQQLFSLGTVLSNHCLFQVLRFPLKHKSFWQLQRWNDSEKSTSIAFEIIINLHRVGLRCVFSIFSSLRTFSLVDIALQQLVTAATTTPSSYNSATVGSNFSSAFGMFFLITENLFSDALSSFSAGDVSAPISLLTASQTCQFMIALQSIHPVAVRKFFGAVVQVVMSKDNVSSLGLTLQRAAEWIATTKVEYSTETRTNLLNSILTITRTLTSIQAEQNNNSNNSNNKSDQLLQQQQQQLAITPVLSSKFDVVYTVLLGRLRNHNNNNRNTTTGIIPFCGCPTWTSDQSSRTFQIISKLRSTSTNCDDDNHDQVPILPIVKRNVLRALSVVKGISDIEPALFATALLFFHPFRSFEHPLATLESSNFIGACQSVLRHICKMNEFEAELIEEQKRLKDIVVTNTPSSLSQYHQQPFHLITSQQLTASVVQRPSSISPMSLNMMMSNSFGNNNNNNQRQLNTSSSQHMDPINTSSFTLQQQHSTNSINTATSIIKSPPQSVFPSSLPLNSIQPPDALVQNTTTAGQGGEKTSSSSPSPGITPSSVSNKNVNIPVSKLINQLIAPWTLTAASLPTFPVPQPFFVDLKPAAINSPEFHVINATLESVTSALQLHSNESTAVSSNVFYHFGTALYMAASCGSPMLSAFLNVVLKRTTPTTPISCENEENESSIDLNLLFYKLSPGNLMKISGDSNSTTTAANNSLSSTSPATPSRTSNNTVSPSSMHPTTSAPNISNVPILHALVVSCTKLRDSKYPQVREAARQTADFLANKWKAWNVKDAVVPSSRAALVELIAEACLDVDKKFVIVSDTENNNNVGDDNHNHDSESEAVELKYDVDERTKAATTYFDALRSFLAPDVESQVPPSSVFFGSTNKNNNKKQQNQQRPSLPISFAAIQTLVSGCFESVSVACSVCRRAIDDELMLRASQQQKQKQQQSSTMVLNRSYSEEEHSFAPAATVAQEPIKDDDYICSSSYNRAKLLFSRIKTLLCICRSSIIKMKNMCSETHGFTNFAEIAKSHRLACIYMVCGLMHNLCSFTQQLQQEEQEEHQPQDDRKRTSTKEENDKNQLSLLILPVVVNTMLLASSLFSHNQHHPGSHLSNAVLEPFFAGPLSCWMRSFLDNQEQEEENESDRKNDADEKDEENNNTNENIITNNIIKLKDIQRAQITAVVRWACSVAAGDDGFDWMNTNISQNLHIEKEIYRNDLMNTTSRFSTNKTEENLKYFEEVDCLSKSLVELHSVFGESYQEHKDEAVKQQNQNSGHNKNRLVTSLPLTLLFRYISNLSIEAQENLDEKQQQQQQNKNNNSTNDDNEKKKSPSPPPVAASTSFDLTNTNENKTSPSSPTTATSMASPRPAKLNDTVAETLRRGTSPAAAAATSSSATPPNNMNISSSPTTMGNNQEHQPQQQQRSSRSTSPAIQQQQQQQQQQPEQQTSNENEQDDEIVELTTSGTKIQQDRDEQQTKPIEAKKTKSHFLKIAQLHVIWHARALQAATRIFARNFTSCSSQILPLFRDTGLQWYSAELIQQAQKLDAIAFTILTQQQQQQQQMLFMMKNRRRGSTVVGGNLNNTNPQQPPTRKRGASTIRRKSIVAPSASTKQQQQSKKSSSVTTIIKSTTCDTLLPCLITIFAVAAPIHLTAHPILQTLDLMFTSKGSSNRGGRSFNEERTRIICSFLDHFLNVLSFPFPQPRLSFSMSSYTLQHQKAKMLFLGRQQEQVSSSFDDRQQQEKVITAFTGAYLKVLSRNTVVSLASSKSSSSSSAQQNHLIHNAFTQPVIASSTNSATNALIAQKQKILKDRKSMTIMFWLKISSLHQQQQQGSGERLSNSQQQDEIITPIMSFRLNNGQTCLLLAQHLKLTSSTSSSSRNLTNILIKYCGVSSSSSASSSTLLDSTPTSSNTRTIASILGNENEEENEDVTFPWMMVVLRIPFRSYLQSTGLDGIQFSVITTVHYFGLNPNLVLSTSSSTTAAAATNSDETSRSNNNNFYIVQDCDCHFPGRHDVNDFDEVSQIELGSSHNTQRRQQESSSSMNEVCKQQSALSFGTLACFSEDLNLTLQSSFFCLGSDGLGAFEFTDPFIMERAVRMQVHLCHKLKQFNVLPPSPCRTFTLQPSTSSSSTSPERRAKDLSELLTRIINIQFITNPQHQQRFDQNSNETSQASGSNSAFTNMLWTKTIQQPQERNAVDMNNGNNNSSSTSTNNRSSILTSAHFDFIGCLPVRLSSSSSSRRLTRTSVSMMISFSNTPKTNYHIQVPEHASSGVVGINRSSNSNGNEFLPFLDVGHWTADMNDLAMMLSSFENSGGAGKSSSSGNTGGASSSSGNNNNNNNSSNHNQSPDNLLFSQGHISSHQDLFVVKGISVSSSSASSSSTTANALTTTSEWYSSTCFVGASTLYNVWPALGDAETFLSLAALAPNEITLEKNNKNTSSPSSPSSSSVWDLQSSLVRVACAGLQSSPAWIASRAVELLMCSLQQGRIQPTLKLAKCLSEHVLLPISSSSAGFLTQMMSVAMTPLVVPLLLSTPIWSVLSSSSSSHEANSTKNTTKQQKENHGRSRRSSVIRRDLELEASREEIQRKQLLLTEQERHLENQKDQVLRHIFENCLAPLLSPQNAFRDLHALMLHQNQALETLLHALVEGWIGHDSSLRSRSDLAPVVCDFLFHLAELTPTGDAPTALNYRKIWAAAVTIISNTEGILESGDRQQEEEDSESSLIWLTNIFKSSISTFSSSFADLRTHLNCEPEHTYLWCLQEVLSACSHASHICRLEMMLTTSSSSDEQSNHQTASSSSYLPIKKRKLFASFLESLQNMRLWSSFETFSIVKGLQYLVWRDVDTSSEHVDLYYYGKVNLKQGGRSQQQVVQEEDENSNTNVRDDENDEDTVNDDDDSNTNLVSDNDSPTNNLSSSPLASSIMRRLTRTLEASTNSSSGLFESSSGIEGDRTNMFSHLFSSSSSSNIVSFSLNDEQSLLAQLALSTALPYETLLPNPNSGFISRLSISQRREAQLLSVWLSMLVPLHECYPVTTPNEISTNESSSSTLFMFSEPSAIAIRKRQLALWKNTRNNNNQTQQQQQNNSSSAASLISDFSFFVEQSIPRIIQMMEILPNPPFGPVTNFNCFYSDRLRELFSTAAKNDVNDEQQQHQSSSTRHILHPFVFVMELFASIRKDFIRVSSSSSSSTVSTVSEMLLTRTTKMLQSMMTSSTDSHEYDDVGLETRSNATSNTNTNTNTTKPSSTLSMNFCFLVAVTVGWVLPGMKVHHHHNKNNKNSENNTEQNNMTTSTTAALVNRLLCNILSEISTEDASLNFFSEILLLELLIGTLSTSNNRDNKKASSSSSLLESILQFNETLLLKQQQKQQNSNSSDNNSFIEPALLQFLTRLLFKSMKLSNSTQGDYALMWEHIGETIMSYELIFGCIASSIGLRRQSSQSETSIDDLFAFLVGKSEASFPAIFAQKRSSSAQSTTNNININNINNTTNNENFSLNDAAIVNKSRDLCLRSVAQSPERFLERNGEVVLAGVASRRFSATPVWGSTLCSLYSKRTLARHRWEIDPLLNSEFVRVRLRRLVFDAEVLPPPDLEASEETLAPASSILSVKDDLELLREYGVHGRHHIVEQKWRGAHYHLQNTLPLTMPPAQVHQDQVASSTSLRVFNATKVVGSFMGSLVVPHCPDNIIPARWLLLESNAKSGFLSHQNQNSNRKSSSSNNKNNNASSLNPGNTLALYVIPLLSALECGPNNNNNNQNNMMNNNNNKTGAVAEQENTAAATDDYSASNQDDDDLLFYDDEHLHHLHNNNNQFWIDDDDFDYEEEEEEQEQNDEEQEQGEEGKNHDGDNNDENHQLFNEKLNISNPNRSSLLLLSDDSKQRKNEKRNQKRRHNTNNNNLEDTPPSGSIETKTPRTPATPRRTTFLRQQDENNTNSNSANLSATLSNRASLKSSPTHSRTHSRVRSSEYHHQLQNNSPSLDNSLRRGHSMLMMRSPRSPQQQQQQYQAITTPLTSSTSVTATTTRFGSGMHKHNQNHHHRSSPHHHHNNNNNSSFALRSPDAASQHLHHLPSQARFEFVKGATTAGGKSHALQMRSRMAMPRQGTFILGSEIRAIFTRIVVLDDSALEIYSNEHEPLMFCFASPDERRTAHKQLEDQLKKHGCFLDHNLAFNSTHVGVAPFSKPTDNLLKRWAKEFAEGKHSVLKFLMILNIAAGRSYNDLRQYPVLPHVLRDRNEKEALSVAHLISKQLVSHNHQENLQLSFGANNNTNGGADDDSSSNNHYLLGSFFRNFSRPMTQQQEGPIDFETSRSHVHYSSKFATAITLVRLMPFTQVWSDENDGKLIYQDRRFLHDLRSLFHKTKRELVPELFSLPDALRNINKLTFDESVNANALVPNWCSDAVHFVLSHREILECPFVRSNIHGWVDLVFGCYQRGEAAENAGNFLPPASCIPIPENVDDMQREAFEMAQEAVLNKVGHTPAQLFAKTIKSVAGVSSFSTTYRNPMVREWALDRTTPVHNVRGTKKIAVCNKKVGPVAAAAATVGESIAAALNPLNYELFSRETNERILALSDEMFVARADGKLVIRCSGGTVSAFVLVPGSSTNQSSSSSNQQINFTTTTKTTTNFDDTLASTATSANNNNNNNTAEISRQVSTEAGNFTAGNNNQQQESTTESTTTTTTTTTTFSNFVKPTIRGGANNNNNEVLVQVDSLSLYPLIATCCCSWFDETMIQSRSLVFTGTSSGVIVAMGAQCYESENMNNSTNNTNNKKKKSNNNNKDDDDVEEDPLVLRAMMIEDASNSSTFGNTSSSASSSSVLSIRGRLYGHTGRVDQVAASSLTLVSASDDGDVLIWDAVRLLLLRRLCSGAFGVAHLEVSDTLGLCAITMTTTNTNTNTSNQLYSVWNNNNSNNNDISSSTAAAAGGVALGESVGGAAAASMSPSSTSPVYNASPSPSHQYNNNNMYRGGISPSSKSTTSKTSSRIVLCHVGISTLSYTAEWRTDEQVYSTRFDPVDRTIVLAHASGAEARCLFNAGEGGNNSNHNQNVSSSNQQRAWKISVSGGVLCTDVSNANFSKNQHAQVLLLSKATGDVLHYSSKK